MKNHHETFSAKDAELIIKFVEALNVGQIRVDPWRYFPGADDSLSMVRGKNGEDHTLTLSSGTEELSAVFSLAHNVVAIQQTEATTDLESYEVKQKLEAVAESLELVCEL